MHLQTKVRRALLVAATISAALGCDGAPVDDGVAMERSALTSGLTKINAGAAAVSPFVADVDYTGGSTKTRANTIDLRGVINPAPAAVYQSQRYGNFTYTLPGFTANGYNKIRLHFCETHWSGPNQRRFNVSINGATVLQNYDSFAAAGAMNRAKIEEFVMKADASGKYTIVFTTILDAAYVSGIEVVSAGTATSDAPGLGPTCTRPAHVVLQSPTHGPMAQATVVPVLWGTGVTLSTTTITNFGTAVANSSYLKWVQGEYGVGPVSFSSPPVMITPANKATTIADGDIATELLGQIAQGLLTPKDVSKIEPYLYMVYFPSSITVKHGTQTQCTDFCAYHNWSTSTLSGKHLFFTAEPYLQNCGTFNGRTCKSSISEDAAMTPAMSHELMETLTDPMVDAWFDPTQPPSCGGEIGDLCVGYTFPLDPTGANILVQEMYSNTAARCQDTSAGSLSDFEGWPHAGAGIVAAGSTGQSTSIPFLRTYQAAGSLSLGQMGWGASDTRFLTDWQYEGVPLYGDFTGDGLADLALTGSSLLGSTIPMVRGGDSKVLNGGITQTKEPAALGTAVVDFTGLISNNEWGPPPVVGDFNGDGRTDIAKVAAQTSSGSFLNTIPVAFSTGDAVSPGSGLFWATNKADGNLNSLWTQSTISPHVLAADFDRDGKTDLALVGGTYNTGTAWGYVYTAHSNGDGSFASFNARGVQHNSGPLVWGQLAASDFAIQPMVGDFNGDGLVDIALLGAETTVWSTIPVAVGKASGSFDYVNLGTNGNAQLAADAAVPGTRIVAGDYNGDGLTDIALLQGTTSLIFAISRGDFTFDRVVNTDANGTNFLSQANGALVLSAWQDLYRQF